MQLAGLVEWKGEKVIHVHEQRGLGKCKVGASHSHERLMANKGNYWMVCGLLKWEGELMGGVWFVWEIGWKLNLWWHMIKQMGDGKDKVQWDMMN